MDKTKILVLALVLVLTINFIPAMTVSVDADNFSPGDEQEITLKIKNTLDESIKDISFEISEEVPFTIINSDEVDEINEDDTENLDVKLKTASDAKAGDYSIPYILKYKLSDDTEEEKEGTFILTIEANPELSYTVNSENAIVGTQGKIKFTIINKGLGDAKFVSVKISPNGYTLLSGDSEYVGTIGSDDFETINFDVIFKDNPSLNAEIEYKDFNNQKIIKNVNLPVTVYTPEEALALGITKQDNTLVYMIAGTVLFKMR
ncbi:MAG: hypothetical protein M1416_00930, partial [Candidatus Pacearchaeota archaeon]|nr:hypothetical protein [Candidatus Pacearchaeota archaeon]